MNADKTPQPTPSAGIAADAIHPPMPPPLPSPEKLNLVELGLTLPFLTVLTYTAIYFQELGFFTFYGIPKAFIQVELLGSIHFALLMLAVSVIIIFVLEILYIKKDNVFTRENSFIVKFAFNPVSVWLAKIVLIAAIAFIGIEACILGGWNIGFCIILGFYGGFLMMIKMVNKKEIHTDIPLEQMGIYSLSVSVGKKLGHLVGSFLVLFGFIGILSFSIGYLNFWVFSGEHKMVTKEKSTIFLLRKYDPYSIYGVYTTATNTQDRNMFMIEYAPDKVDTIRIKDNPLQYSFPAWHLPSLNKTNP